MRSHSSDFSELRGLLEALCDESITDEQMKRLEESVLRHPEAEAFYVQYMSLHADLIAHFGPLASLEHSLRDRLAADTEIPGAMYEAPISNRSGISQIVRASRRNSIAVGLIAASLVLAVFFINRSWSTRRGVQEAARRVEAVKAEVLDDSVAVLLQATAAQWDTSDLPTTVGSPLSPGWLRLKSGLVHIEFYSGANVILEGPAEFQIISRMKAYCAQGKLRATVPPQAHGFEIDSPKLKLIDRGTEFGFMVSTDGHTELHVFEGKVEFDKRSDMKEESYTAVTTGQGVRLDTSGKISSIQLDSSAFQTARDLMVSSEAEIRRVHQKWEQFGRELRRDNSMLVHFTFRDEDSGSRTLINEIRASEVQDGAIVGCSWIPGRWTGKQALEFTQVSDRVRFYVPGEFHSLTFMAWVRVDALNNQFNSLLMTDGWDEGEAHWHIWADGTLELGVQGPQKKSNAHYEAPAAITTEHYGRWSHLAVVYDGDSGYVRHFVNGRSITRVPLKFSSLLRIGKAEIGNWNISNHRNKSPVRNFNGGIDEVMIFGRAVGESEIEQIYNMGKPPE